MNKNQGLLLGIALMLLFTSITLATSTTLSATSHVILHAFDQNPAGSDKGNEWVTLYNPSNASVEIGNWVLETADSERETIPEGTTLYPFAYYVYTPPYQWLDNSDEAITLSDSKGEVVDKTPRVSDNENDNRYWMRNNSEWVFSVRELEKDKIWSGVVKHVVDGDTVDVSFDIYGIQRIRLVGVNTPERGEEGYEEAKEFVNQTCLGEAVKLDVDDKEQYDPYYRLLAVVYVNETNLNEKLLREGYAEIMYIPPSEFNPYEWKADYTPATTTTPIPGFEFVFDIDLMILVIGILTLGAVSYPHIRDWIKRPKVELTWSLRSENELGVTVKNKGKNAAEKVYAEVKKDNIRIPIQWESDLFGHDQGAVFVNISQGDFNRHSFRIYLPELKVNDVRMEDISHITVELSWEYRGVTKTKDYKIPTNVFAK